MIASTTLTGYLHPLYAESLCEFGSPVYLPNSGGWLLKRAIPNSYWFDAMGCYPLFLCKRWDLLDRDLSSLGQELVSAVLVTDPFADVTPDYLSACFDYVRKFKAHYLVELATSLDKIGSKHHRYYARRSLSQIGVNIVEHPDSSMYLSDWVGLYDCLIRRHDLRGVQAFSALAFCKQLQIPGTVLFLAVQGDTPVAGHIWYVDGEVAYSHLAAASPLGYELDAMYGLYLTAIKYFQGRVKYLDLGAGAGSTDHQHSGLAWFKKGWASTVKDVYVCGRILDPDKYAELSTQHTEEQNYFPAYRASDVKP
jgi:hypothetical protein